MSGAGAVKVSGGKRGKGGASGEEKGRERKGKEGKGGRGKGKGNRKEKKG